MMRLRASAAVLRQLHLLPILPLLLLPLAGSTSTADLVLHGARLPGSDEAVTIEIRKGLIVHVGEPRLDSGKDAELHDINGAWVVPGLADMHVHLERFDDPAVLGQFLAAGVTTVRSMAGGEQVRRWRREIASGERLGPQILLGSNIIEGRQRYWRDSLTAGTARDGRELARTLHREGVSFLKVYHTLPASAFVGLTGEARVLGIPVVGHVPNTIRLAAALEAGMVSIEHFRGYGAAAASRAARRRSAAWTLDYLALALDPERLAHAVAATATSGAWNCPTLLQRDQLDTAARVRARFEAAPLEMVPLAIRRSWDPANWRPGTVALMRQAEDSEVFELGRENRSHLLRALAEAGAPLLAGSDTPSPFIAPGQGLHEELAVMEAAGLTRTQVLASATREPGRFAARHLSAEVPFGQVVAGHRGDLVVLAGDPTVDLMALVRPTAVVLGGRWLGRDTLDRLHADALARHAVTGEPAAATPNPGDDSAQ